LRIRGALGNLLSNDVRGTLRAQSAAIHGSVVIWT
jgi:hypothetical protein